MENEKIEYVGRILTPIKIQKSLSQERYEKAMRRKYETTLSRENNTEQGDNTSPAAEVESLVIPPEEQNSEIINSDEKSEEKYFGKDVVIKPLAYFSLDDSLKHAISDYKEQIKSTTNLIMAKRAKYGQRLATINDKKDVLGEYPEKRTTEVVVPEASSTGPGLKLKRHYFTRPINGIMYRISIDEHPMGIGQSRRNSYMLVDIAAIFYRKNGIGLGKEIVVRSKILRFRKREPR
jgi:hypothetical protein